MKTLYPSYEDYCNTNGFHDFRGNEHLESLCSVGGADQDRNYRRISGLSSLYCEIRSNDFDSEPGKPGSEERVLSSLWELNKYRDEPSDRIEWFNNISPNSSNPVIQNAFDDWINGNKEVLRSRKLKKVGNFVGKFCLFTVITLIATIFYLN